MKLTCPSTSLRGLSETSWPGRIRCKPGKAEGEEEDMFLFFQCYKVFQKHHANAMEKLNLARATRSSNYDREEDLFFQFCKKPLEAMTGEYIAKRRKPFKTV